MPSKLNAFLPQRSPIIPGAPSAAKAGKANIAVVKTLKNRAWRFMRVLLSFSACSKIRRVRCRDVSVLIGIILRLIIVLDIFGADAFLPCRALSAQIGLGGRPRHGEDTLILHGEFELQALAPVAAIDIVPDARPLFFSPIQPFLGGFII